MDEYKNGSKRLRVKYLACNNAWVIRHNDQIISIGPHNRRTFNTKKELEQELLLCGLKVGNHGSILPISA